MHENLKDFRHAKKSYRFFVHSEKTQKSDTNGFIVCELLPREF